MPRSHEKIHPTAALANTIGTLVDGMLAAGESERGVVSRLCVGGAFEGWLAFESRLLLERHLDALGLETRGHAHPEDRYWVANEWRKIDLALGDWEARSEDEALLALEFKLIHNNKDWMTQADAVWADLFPNRPEKADLRLSMGRLAVVGVIGKVYRKGVARYPGVRENLREWETELEEWLLPASGWHGKRAVRLWRGRRFPLKHPWLLDDAESFFQLHILGGE